MTCRARSLVILHWSVRIALHAGDLGLEFSGDYLLTSTGKDFPLLVEIAQLLPAEDGARGRALRNQEAAQLVMRITDRRIDACVQKKVKGLTRLLEERSMIVNGHLQRLHTLHHAALCGLLASRGIVVSRSTKFLKLQEIADDYLKACKDRLVENKRRLKLIVMQC
jgi:hypothetical protein